MGTRQRAALHCSQRLAQFRGHHLDRPTGSTDDFNGPPVQGGAYAEAWLELASDADDRHNFADG